MVLGSYWEHKGRWVGCGHVGLARVRGIECVVRAFWVYAGAMLGVGAKELGRSTPGKLGNCGGIDGDVTTTLSPGGTEKDCTSSGVHECVDVWGDPGRGEIPILDEVGKC